ncbi:MULTISPECIES: aromatic amino acid ammonia-lyase [Treponema]|uniref:Aromatic amino acid lyase n=1 Tax=Treponema rectale TaxID=744512 RepID=A0A840S9Z6_9SPIR|nr:MULTISPECIES: aromatic amino acid ammonia-lyase [Treponema]MBB5218527.1 histidine ammonia-lyase/phenylalanine ammonia-lyase [Treponema rectale]MBE6354104.1 aromatic amino acid lyase [Treponema sp.]MBO6176393.1 aromatic amino acid lyase [Treponema sp.]QOS39789.1 aromatic amino acid lyase [Treponema rectale]
MRSIVVDGNSLTIEDVCDVAEQKVQVKLPSDKKFWNIIEKSRKFLMDYISTGVPTYGVTTDFGDSCANQISVDKAGELQRDIVAYHGIGLGKKFDVKTGRAVVLTRLNMNVKGGHSAIRPELARMMLALLEHDIIPVIPELGSVGASGDLTPLSYLAAVIMGDRDAYYKGKIVPAKKALKAEGLEPLLIEAKEGLAIMNGTAVMTAVASLAWKKAERLANISDFLTAVTSEITGGKDTPFVDKVSRIKNHSGQVESAAYVYKIIKDSKRVFKYEDFLKNKIDSLNEKKFLKQQNKIQDRYSIRCAPQITGVYRDTLDVARKWITEELNAASDNPLVDIEAGRLYNTGNFYGGHICAACDYMRTALANISDLSDKQAEVIIDGKFNGLTENLIPYTADDDPRAGLRLGFKAAQITISAIRGEIMTYTFPVSLTSHPTEALNQDKVSMGTISARKFAEQIELVYLQFATHLLAAMQAVDLAGKEDFSPFTRKVYEQVRAISRFVKDDRPLDKDAEKVAVWLKETSLFA